MVMLRTFHWTHLCRAFTSQCAYITQMDDLKKHKICLIRKQLKEHPFKTHSCSALAVKFYTYMHNHIIRMYVYVCIVCTIYKFQCVCIHKRTHVYSVCVQRQSTHTVMHAHLHGQDKCLCKYVFCILNK